MARTQSVHLTIYPTPEMQEHLEQLHRKRGREVNQNDLIHKHGMGARRDQRWPRWLPTSPGAILTHVRLLSHNCDAAHPIRNGRSGPV